MLSEQDKEAIFGAMKVHKFDNSQLFFTAGCLIGLAMTDRYEIDLADRITLATASEFLRRHAVATHFEQHGEMP